jgi:Na+-transporting NADH:ubiquinone oxidoreductase subunit C
MAHTLTVAVLTALVCSVLVTAAAIQLKPRQELNEAINRQQNILEVAGLMREDASIEELFANIDARVVELETGEYAEDIDPASFNPEEAALDPNLGVAVPADADIAKLKRRARFGEVYLVKDGDQVTSIILPVSGAGLWSKMYGFIALQNDGNTIQGLQFYEHAETPGLGDQLDKPKWMALWEGKQVYDAAGVPQIEVIRGNVDRARSSASPPVAGDPAFQIDGMAGATLTGRGVTNLVRYWLSDQGYGPYLNRYWLNGGEQS